MLQKAVLITSTLLATARAQQVGTYTAETHPSLTWQTCTSANECTTVDGSVVIDANWRWIHSVNSSTNCYTGNTWDATLCPDDESCAVNCAVEGAAYSSTYGVTTSGSELRINYVTQNSNGANVGARLYLLKDESTYETFSLLGNEFTFDVDVANLPCGLNGALYFTQMQADGGLSEYTNNKAGAKYGVGYCDSQCPRDLKFIDGEGNAEDWEPSSTDSNTGVGGHGNCCAEMDIWEANSISYATTAHPCSSLGQTECDGDDCGGTYSAERYAGVCDPDGCDFNPYRLGNTSFYGPGSDFTVNTDDTITVVTQFITDTGSTSGTLSAIKRFFVQNGKVIAQANSETTGISGNEITAAYCEAENSVFDGAGEFSAKGGLSQMSAALAEGMVLVLSLWDDDYASMLWLDSDYPTNETASTPGVARGSCSTSSGVPATIRQQDASSYVTFSNIKFGAINSTFTAS
ncbi:1,4-beta-D-glucan cellobiohydrolase B [Talaromyces atroroseus]|uniref:Glucanase n=1 Tax=Talaromyces atroroseus TaxID=1441469 RepID=A0A225ALV9_TALAT|nr:1,4-beta-D-glucan cellobiohydrolase B [Talaromyces atroroseus]OKL59304.1 1,4-beta-D-glucan cellobiohydrolase B [Talaromyces atroroseus]